MPFPAPCLLMLRAQVDLLAPLRSKRSDGIMGDLSHQMRKSDHNLGNAIDLTHDPTNGFSAAALAEELRRQMTSAPNGRLSYIIWARGIASVRSQWAWKPYSGPNPHSNHVHLSIRAELRSVMRPWKLS